jgi:hypothetical protein
MNLNGLRLRKRLLEMTKDEAERMAKRKNDAPGHKKGLDGWRYIVGSHGGVAGGYAVFRQRGDASAKELYRTNLQ